MTCLECGTGVHDQSCGPIFKQNAPPEHESIKQRLICGSLSAGTRTLVTTHFGKPELVVFFWFGPKLLCDAVLVTKTRSPRRHLASPGSTHGCRFTRLFGLGRFLFESAPRSHGKLLLRLLASQNLCGLRENVRIAEIRFAVVGRNLQETSLQCSRRDTRCWPARTSSRTFRARFQQVTCSAG